MDKSKTYTETFGRLAHWMIGQRAFHDLVIHPLMAVSGYADWVVKLHDYHAFKTSKPEDENLVGVTGSLSAVQTALDRIGGEVRHYHKDGMLCYGITNTGYDYEPRPKENCPKCGGTGTFTAVRSGVGRNSREHYAAKCPCIPSR